MTRKIFVVGAVAIALAVISFGDSETCAAGKCPRKVAPEPYWTQQDCEACCSDTAGQFFGWCVRQFKCSSYPSSKGKKKG